MLGRVDPSLPERFPLVCPACRRRGDDGWHVHTLTLTSTFRGAGHVRDGILTCQNPACRREYPVLDGIPMIARPLAAAVLTEPPTAPELVSILLLDEADDTQLARVSEHLSIYLDTQWGDRTTPALDTWGFAGLMRLLEGWCRAPVERAVDLGTGLGRALAHLNARQAVGLDQHFAGLRRARDLLAGETVVYARRDLGRWYAPARASGLATAASLCCGDALDPPFAPASVDRVVALNLLDVVSDPPRLLDVAAGLLAPGGELLLSAPFAWQSGAVDEDKRLGSPDPRPAIAARLAEHGVEIVETAEVGWSLRRDARAQVVYQVHALRGRRVSV
jgi:SAM-dependent methyltransferase/uncharacterized protein YbaR (Trm112 family)